MIYKAAPMSRAIKVVTTGVLALVLAFVAGGLLEKHLPLVGLFVGVVTFICYLLAPVAYDTTGGQLTVLLRAGKKSFGPITDATSLSGRWPFTLRLLGNGGVFAGTGIYWNKPHGVFRAYVTSARLQDAVLITTDAGKVMISPEDPQSFLAITSHADPV
ncbi:MAG: PH domain-containing protein [Kiritimatiellaeota bacterium]|nr:PH domain-containing protein [Kiritimatiellota bacterium]